MIALTARRGASSGSGLVGRLHLTASKLGQARVNFGSGTATSAAGQTMSIGPMSAVVSVLEGAGQAGAPAGAPKPAQPGAEAETP